MNRYAGAVEWSVLQHSLLVWDLVKNQSATAQAWALLHDAAECWIGDALLPAKQVAGLAWSNLEDTYNGHIQRLAGIQPDQHESMIVADADKEACRLEMQMTSWGFSNHQCIRDLRELSADDIRENWTNDVPYLLCKVNAKSEVRTGVIRDASRQTPRR